MIEVLGSRFAVRLLPGLAISDLACKLRILSQLLRLSI